MAYYIVLLKDGSFKIYKNKHDQKSLPEGARQFECSSNVTVQDLYDWAKKGFKGFRSIKEIEE